jgi:hypothetical protein
LSGILIVQKKLGSYISNDEIISWNILANSGIWIVIGNAEQMIGTHTNVLGMIAKAKPSTEWN